MRIVLLPITLLLLNCSAFELNAQDSLDLFILNQAERFDVPGIAACVVKGDQIVWSNAYGYANIEDEEPMSTNGVMNIASVSKTITATAVMQLWEQGQIKLDTDVSAYLPFKVVNPNFPDEKITIQQLLTHTSSIKDGPAYKEGYDCGDPTRSLKNWIENYFSEKGTFYDREHNFHDAKPAEHHQYSNVAFGLLGLVVELVSEMPFHIYCKVNIFDPLDMKDTGYLLTEVDTSRLITPYLHIGKLQAGAEETRQYVKPYFNPYCFYSFWNYPDGLVRTTVEDLAKFTIAYMNGGVYKAHRILDAATIDKMHSSQLSEELNEDQDQGLSWFSSSSLAPSWFHGGSDPGVSTRMYVNKEDKISVIVFQNANEDNAFYTVKKLYEAFYDH